MRVLLDESVRGPVAERLIASGHSVFRVKDLAPSAADEDLPALAQSLGALFITFDKGFGVLVFVMRERSAGILLGRLSNLTPDAKADRIDAVLREYGDRLAVSFTVVRPDRVRIRALDRPPESA